MVYAHNRIDTASRLWCGFARAWAFVLAPSLTGVRVVSTIGTALSLARQLSGLCRGVAGQQLLTKFDLD